MDFRFIPVFLVTVLVSWVTVVAGTAVLKRNPSLREPRVFKIWFIAFFIVSCLDMHSTYLMIRELGIHVEGSIIPFLTFKYLGVIPGIMFRLTVVMVIFYFVFRRFPEFLVGLLLYYPFIPILNYWTVSRVL